MITGFTTHDEAMIKTFMEEPNYAQLYLDEVLKDGDCNEIQRVQEWYNEAKKRTQAQSYWNNLTNNAQIAIQNGLDLKIILNYLNEATKLVKAAMA